MKEKRRLSRQEMSDSRRSELIDATLRVIATDGVKGATVRAIAEEAAVTQGLIRYYFRSKDELIIAAHERHMTNLIEVAVDAADGDYDCARTRLAMFVQASVSLPIIDPQGIALWAGFFQLVFHSPDMRASHQKTYHLLRNHLSRLAADVFEEAGRDVSEAELRTLSIACNAVLDGLWIEGGALPDQFADNELTDAALSAFEGLLNVELRSTLR